MKLSLEDLQDKLNQQLRLMHTSIDNFDKGLEDEALHLATRLRVLLHDNNPRPGQGSLLGQLGLKNTIDFYDSTLGLSNNSSLNTSYNGLVLTFIGEKTGIKFIPMLDQNIEAKFINFDNRREGIIFIDINGDRFSRKDIILFISDQDGGAHLDGKIKEKDANLTKRNSLGIKVGNEKNWKDVSGLEYLSVRQITHEVLKSLDHNYTCENNLQGESGYLMGGNISFG